MTNLAINNFEAVARSSPRNILIGPIENVEGEVKNQLGVVYGHCSASARVSRANCLGSATK